jgi:protein-disulfide isomerase
MKKNHLLFVIIICIMGRSNAGIADMVSKTESFSQCQTKQIQQIIHDYIVNNPDVILEAGKKLQEQEEAKEKIRAEKIKNSVPPHKKEIFDATSPGRIVTGNPNGKIIIAEFTQYQCPHCRVVAPLLDKLLKDNPDVQRITIYWPFFGNDAVYAVKAVLAAQKQNKFHELNQAMMATQEFITKDKVDSIIKTIPGLDAKKLQSDMDAKGLDNGLKANFKLAGDLGLVGTPVFVFANKKQTKFSLVLGQTRNFADDLNRSLKEVR